VSWGSSRGRTPALASASRLASSACARAIPASPAASQPRSGNWIAVRPQSHIPHFAGSTARPKPSRPRQPPGNENKAAQSRASQRWEGCCAPKGLDCPRCRSIPDLLAGVRGFSDAGPVFLRVGDRCGAGHVVGHPKRFGRCRRGNLRVVRDAVRALRRSFSGRH